MHNLATRLKFSVSGRAAVPSGSRAIDAQPCTFLCLGAAQPNSGAQSGTGTTGTTGTPSAGSRASRWGSHPDTRSGWMNAMGTNDTTGAGACAQREYDRRRARVEAKIRGVQALEEAHVVEAVTERVRGRAFAAIDVLDEFDEFEDLDTASGSASPGSTEPDARHDDRSTFARTSSACASSSTQSPVCSG